MCHHFYQQGNGFWIYVGSSIEPFFLFFRIVFASIYSFLCLSAWVSVVLWWWVTVKRMSSKWKWHLEWTQHNRMHLQNKRQHWKSRVLNVFISIVSAFSYDVCIATRGKRIIQSTIQHFDRKKSVGILSLLLLFFRNLFVFKNYQGGIVKNREKKKFHYNPYKFIKTFYVCFIFISRLW